MLLCQRQVLQVLSQDPDHFRLLLVLRLLYFFRLVSCLHEALEVDVGGAGLLLIFIVVTCCLNGCLVGLDGNADNRCIVIVAHVRHHDL